MLAYHLRQSAKGQHLKALRNLKAQGVNVPSVADEPQVHAPNLWLWTGFCLLSEKRWRTSEVAIPQPIAVSEIKALADYQGITEHEQRACFFAVISTLDTQYMKDFWERRAEHQKTEADKRARRQRQ